ncbi:hypothetical protein E2C01_088160 [Portunus trituberculatus]|uniref:Uncharacterized protein n=1 Tax=Portunus trituberculatus TaxID=210409 RepID=A0A5B7JL68_PORTR|nr:hypothetical protein [Portunus trituberculatus]
MEMRRGEGWWLKCKEEQEEEEEEVVKMRCVCSGYEMGTKGEMGEGSGGDGGGDEWRRRRRSSSGNV